MMGDPDDGLYYMVHDIERVKLDACFDVVRIKQMECPKEILHVNALE